MVVFICPSCGGSIKKNQVEKHFERSCFNSSYVSCMDCLKEFFGDDYKSHNKCLTENEKYGGKNYVATVNKGELKQEQWITNLQEIIENTSLPRDTKQAIEKIMEFTNIPRKKPKFVNFITNSIPYINMQVIEKCWDLFSKAQVKNVQPALQKKGAADEAPSEDKKIVTKNNDAPTSSKKRKQPEGNDSAEEVEGEANQAAKKFKIEEAVKHILSERLTPECKALAIKTLQKKFLRKYKKEVAEEDKKPEEKILKKFNKIINDASVFKIVNDDQIRFRKNKKSV